MRAWWYATRWRIAGMLVGFDLEEEIDASYEAGRQYGFAERFMKKSSWSADDDIS